MFWSSHFSESSSRRSIWGDCQNYGPFLGTLNLRCRIIIGTQIGTIILTTTHMFWSSCFSEATIQV